MTKGQATIGIVTVGSAIALFYAGWIGWASIKVINNSEQIAARIKWEEITDSNQKDYQNSTDSKLKDVANDVTELKIDAATTKELVRLMSTRFQINPDVVEARVKARTEKEDTIPETLSSITNKQI